MANHNGLKYVLLVDDDEDDCFIFSNVVKEINAEINLVCLHNCSQVLKTLKNQSLPDVIFLDINMPPVDGHICLKEIKKIPGCENIPVVIYSTSTSTHAIEEAYKNGANSYIVKPNSEKQLKEIIAEIFEVI